MVLLRNDTSFLVLVVGKAKRACVRILQIWVSVVTLGHKRPANGPKLLFTIALPGIKIVQMRWKLWLPHTGRILVLSYPVNPNITACTHWWTEKISISSMIAERDVLYTSLRLGCSLFGSSSQVHRECNRRRAMRSRARGADLHHSKHSCEFSWSCGYVSGYVISMFF